MEYSKLVSVSGLGGLFELISSKADGGVVRSLEDKSTKFVSTRLHRFSHLESIEIYTTKENVNLVEIFDAIKASKEKLPDAKADNKTLQDYFKKVYPDMDFERVYVSDMKKMIKWYEILTANNVEIKLSENVEGEVAAETKTNQPKVASNSQTTVKNAPAKKINAPRKMA
ncbi:DUF5606 family protein [Ferruginibacter albus]|uniref:DUF5606 family protein n=1 Tax=Ferruginibacter albus TaxID=2875540 RepID=UPI001CC51C6C|nr:DUF5606 domain-containing protein [Ferruginibacter albus]UAY51947.1 DUF5606 domain-containing protein [Ferruginibacter albus]